MLVVESIKMPNVKKLSIDQLVDLARTYDLLTSDIEEIIITKQLINFVENCADQELPQFYRYRSLINNIFYNISKIFKKLYDTNSPKDLFLQFDKFKKDYMKKQNIDKTSFKLDNLLFTIFYGDIYIKEYLTKSTIIR